MMYAIDLFNRHKINRTRATLPDDLFLQTSFGLVPITTLLKRSSGLWAIILTPEPVTLLVHGWYRVLEGRTDPGPPQPHNFIRRF